MAARIGKTSTVRGARTTRPARLIFLLKLSYQPRWCVLGGRILTLYKERNAQLSVSPLGQVFMTPERIRCGPPAALLTLAEDRTIFDRLVDEGSFQNTK